MIIKIEADLIGIKDPIRIVPSMYLQTQASKIVRTLNNLNIQSLKQQIADKKKADKKATEKKETESDDEKESKKDELKELEEQLKEAEQHDKEIEQEKEITEKCFDFLKDALKLTKEQVETAYQTLEGFEQLSIFVNYVVAQIKSGGKQNLAKMLEFENTETDPKKG